MQKNEEIISDKQKVLGEESSSNLFFIFALCVLLYMSYQLFFTSSFSSQSKGKTAPSLILTQLQDGLEKKPLFNKKTTIVHFWATWCGVCVSELHSSSLRAKAFQKENIQYLLVNVDTSKSRKQVLAFLKESGIKQELWPHHFYDTSYQIARKYGVRALPSLFIINQKGKLISSAVGHVSASSIRKTIENTQKKKP